MWFPRLWYVGFSADPPVYPTRVRRTPGRLPNRESGPQNQPRAKFAASFTSSALITTFFLGGWLGPFAIGRPLLGIVYFAVKSYLVYFVIIWIRGTLPRVRVFGGVTLEEFASLLVGVFPAKPTRVPGSPTRAPAS